jgi:ribosomal protein L40E
MPEILTESFCERCGTRYTFEAGAPQTKRPTVAKARVLVRGLRNFVMSNDPLEAALADARRDDERARATAQMEAFHQTFNFCMDCRQYTCTSCWNEVDGRCLTCAPMPGRIETAMATLEPIALPLPEASANGHDREEAWPTIDLPAPEEPVAIVEAATVAAEPQPAAVVEAQTAPAADSVIEAPADAYLPEQLTPVELPEEEPAEPEVVAAPEPEVVAAPEPEAATVEPEAEPEVVEPPTAPEAPLAPPPPPRVAPAWTIVAPDVATEHPAPAWPPRSPVYHPPTAPPRPEETPAIHVPSWPRPAAPVAQASPPAATVWEESSVGVVNRPGSGVQACFSCGLPLSASARFCRRCGSRQE